MSVMCCPLIVPSLAALSASSLPSVPTCAFIQFSVSDLTDVAAFSILSNAFRTHLDLIRLLHSVLIAACESDSIFTNFISSSCVFAIRY